MIQPQITEPNFEECKPIVHEAVFSPSIASHHDVAYSGFRCIEDIANRGERVKSIELRSYNSMNPLIDDPLRCDNHVLNSHDPYRREDGGGGASHDVF